MEETISQLKGKAKDRKGNYRGKAAVRLVKTGKGGIRLEIIRNKSLESSIKFSQNSFNQFFKDMLIQKAPEQKEVIKESSDLQKELRKSLKLLNQKPELIEKREKSIEEGYEERRAEYGKALPDVLYIIYQNWLEWFDLYDFRPIYNSYYRTGDASRWLNRLEKKEYLHTRESNDGDLEKQYRLTDQAINKIEWWEQENII